MPLFSDVAGLCEAGGQPHFDCQASGVRDPSYKKRMLVFSDVAGLCEAGGECALWFIASRLEDSPRLVFEGKSPRAG